jgi:hypothetical protein
MSEEMPTISSAVEDNPSSVFSSPENQAKVLNAHMSLDHSKSTCPLSPESFLLGTSNPNSEVGFEERYLAAQQQQQGLLSPKRSNSNITGDDRQPLHRLSGLSSGSKCLFNHCLDYPLEVSACSTIVCIILWK